MPTVTGAHAKRIVLLLWALVAFFYFYLSYDYIRVSMNDQSFGDYLAYVVLVKAEELGLPVTGQEINISGGGESLKVSVGYDMDIDIPLLQRQIYTKHFDHNVQYKQKY